jgi:hypothetical protein
VEEQKKMKKILLVLLTILVAGGLFAQVTFSGNVKSGLNIVQTDDKADANDNKPVVKLWNDDAGHRFYIEGKLDFADNYGLSFGFNTKAGLDTTYDYARFYGEFLDDMLKLTVGSGTGTAWGTGGKLDKGFDDLKGLKLEIKPTPELDVGFQLRTELDGAAAMTVEQWFKETVIGAKYESDLFRVVAALALDSDYVGGNDYDGKSTRVVDTPESWTVAGTTVTHTAATYKTQITNDDGKQTRALFAVDIKAVPNLEAKLQAFVLGLGDLDTYGVAAIGQNLGYQVTPELKAGSSFAERLNLRKEEIRGKDAKTLKIEAEPYVNYKLSSLITLDFNVPFSMGWNEDATPTKDIEYKVGVRPKVTFNLNDNANISAWYRLDLTKEKYVASGAADIDAVTKNTVQVNFEWKF